MTKKKSSAINHQSSVARQNWFFTHPYQTILFIGILLYAQILSFGLVHFDDHGFVLMAADMLKLSNIPEFFRHSIFWVLGDTTQNTDVFYRPLQNVVYAICNTFSPKQAWGYHFTGLLFHIGTCAALFAFLKEMKYNISVCLAFALMYSVHPVLVQGVAWIAGLGDQMAALFSLLSLIYFARANNPDRKNKLQEWIFHFLFFVFALFSKEISIMIIPLSLLLFFLIQKDKLLKPLLLPFFAWGVITVVYFFMRNSAIYSSKSGLVASALESFRVNGPLLFEYFEKIFLPYRLSPIPSRDDAQLLAGGIILLALIAAFVFRKRFTRLAFFGITWFVVFLFPTFIQQNSQAHFFAFEHRLYLPLIGILICIIELVNIKSINLNSTVQKFGFASVLLILFAVTFFHSRTFADPYTFYDKAISSSPKSVIAYNGFGKLLLEDKKYAEAIEAFKKSHAYKSDDLQTTGKIAEVYLKNLNNPQEAIVWFKKTLAIDSNSVEAAVSIGDAYWNFIHDTANAIRWYRKSLEINPGNEFAAANLGIIYTGMGQNEPARNYFSIALKTNPENLLALKWMAISFYNENKIQESITQLLKAFAWYPDDADVQRNLMICYYRLNDLPNTRKFAELFSKSNNPIPPEIEAYLKTNGR